jgi:hypothetical protein
MKTHVLVFAHRGTENQLRLHLPYWTAQARANGRVLLIAAEHALTPAFHAHCRAHARHIYLVCFRECKNCKNGPESIKRYLRGLSYTRSFTHPDDVLIVHEYDSLSLDPLTRVVAAGDEIHSNLFTNTRVEPFLGNQFLHMPWIMTAATAHKIYTEYSKHLALTSENGVMDRWLGLLCTRLGVKTPRLAGYSQNTIEEQHIPGLTAAINAGATHIHGLKEPATTRLALALYHRHTKQPPGLADLAVRHPGVAAALMAH